MTQKERIESKLHTAISESKHAIKELADAAMRHDCWSVGYWEEMSRIRINEIEDYAQQLKEVNAN